MPRAQPGHFPRQVSVRHVALVLPGSLTEDTPSVQSSPAGRKETVLVHDFRCQGGRGTHVDAMHTCKSASQMGRQAVEGQKQRQSLWAYKSKEVLILISETVQEAQPREVNLCPAPEKHEGL
ncbi:UNVERIFIED_CONTAM: hypothetical protein K2H54_044496 [Gekko kuhli]